MLKVGRTLRGRTPAKGCGYFNDNGRRRWR